MSAFDLTRRLKALLAEPLPNEAALQVIVGAYDKFVSECESDERLADLEKELQAIHSAEVDLSNAAHTEVFLAILHALIPRLSATTIISGWWEQCLRPAFKEPRLSAKAVYHAKELVISALQNVKTQYSKPVGEFRRRLVDLYLRDAFNEGSGDDVLEWAEMSPGERDKRSVWKSNLEDILIKHGSERPTDLLDEIHEYFTTNSSYRLQLLTLLNSYTSQASFPSSAAPILASHPLITSLLLSLQLDNSSTVCTIALTILIKLLPIFAVEAGDKLKDMVPRMLAVLARIICWKERPFTASGSTRPSGLSADRLSIVEEEVEAVVAFGTVDQSKPLDIRPELNWQRLELSFESAASSAPPPQQFFTFLYYLFPCNTIRFLRHPTQYLMEKQTPSPYTLDWEEALDEAHIKSRSEGLLRAHTMHPLLIWGDARTELENEPPWAQYDVSQIVGECTLLDVRNAGLASRHRDAQPAPRRTGSGLGVSTRADDVEEMVTPRVYVVNLPPANPRPRLSLQDMVASSLVLQSGRDIDVAGFTPDSSRSIFATLSAPTTPALASPRSPPHDVGVARDDGMPVHAVQAISKLQRDVLLLRNELNLELWLNRENVKHIGRLYEEKILSKNAEIERQALHNRLREYKKTVARLHEDFTTHQAQAAITKEKNTEWNTVLQNKLQALREHKRRWEDDTASLKSENADLKAKLDAQGTLLAEATRHVFTLETRIKETAHKVDRLHDYEARIKQLTATQGVWDADARRYADQKEEMAIIVSNYKKMQLLVESYRAQMEEQGRIASERAHDLEAQLARLSQQSEPPRQRPPLDLSAYSAEKTTLTAANRQLREQVDDLRDEVEKLQVELERSKASLGQSSVK